MSVLHSFVINDPSYMFERVLRIPRVINMLGIEFTRVVAVFFFYKFDKYTLYKLT